MYITNGWTYASLAAAAASPHGHLADGVRLMAEDFRHAGSPSDTGILAYTDRIRGEFTAVTSGPECRWMGLRAFSLYAQPFAEFREDGLRAERGFRRSWSDIRLAGFVIPSGDASPESPLVLFTDPYLAGRSSDAARRSAAAAAEEGNPPELVPPAVSAAEYAAETVAACLIASAGTEKQKDCGSVTLRGADLLAACVAAASRAMRQYAVYGAFPCAAKAAEDTAARLTPEERCLFAAAAEETYGF